MQISRNIQVYPPQAAKKSMFIRPVRVIRVLKMFFIEVLNYFNVFALND